MCGICGIAIPSRSGRRLERPTLERMREQLLHRGPDGAGLFCDSGPWGAIGLGHRRLSIVDVAHGAQPMRSDDGRFQVVYNGEVYNHPTIMGELQQQGVRYETHCDTETVLHLYERHGERTPERLRGMFAFAVWDAGTRSLLLARDRFGVKPLYYAVTDDGTLVFGSEMKAVLESGMVTPSLNWGVLPDYLANHAPSGEETLFAGIRRLPPGHTLRWQDGQVTIRRYWDLSFAGADRRGRSERDIVAEYTERLREAVRIRLMADVPLGVFLSGGIDSAAITSLMSELVDERVKTFSVAFAEREANELRYARLVAERCGTDHHEIVVSPEQFFDAMPRMVWHEDEPIAHPSSIALYFVSHLASQHVKVVLSGEGSDETLAGYARYGRTVLQMEWGRRWEAMAPGALRGGVKRLIESRPNVGFAAKLRRTFLTRPADLDSLYFDNFSVFSREQQSHLLSPASRARVGAASPYAAYHAALDRADGKTLLSRLLYADVSTYLHELLMKQDQMSMAASIESRVPFLDHQLVEWVSQLDDDMKLRGLGTKRVLREAMRDRLPAEILSRKKMGFPVPVGAWFRGPYRGIVDEYVLGARAADRGIFDPAWVRQLVARHMAGENHSERLWSLVNFEVWMRTFLDGEVPADASLAGQTARMPAATR